MITLDIRPIEHLKSQYDYEDSSVYHKMTPVFLDSIGVRYALVFGQLISIQKIKDAIEYKDPIVVTECIKLPLRGGDVRRDYYIRRVYE